LRVRSIVSTVVVVIIVIIDQRIVSKRLQWINLRSDSFIRYRILDVIDRLVVSPEEGAAPVAVINVLRPIVHQRMKSRGIDMDLSGIGEQTSPEGPGRERKNQLEEEENKEEKEEEEEEEKSEKNTIEKEQNKERKTFFDEIRPARS
jgi:hypothetical protein